MNGGGIKINGFLLIFLLGTGLFLLQYFWVGEIKKFKKMKIEGVVISFNKRGSTYRTWQTVTTSNKYGKDYEFNNGLEDKIINYRSFSG